MEIKDIEKSRLYPKIIFSLISGNEKLAEDIAKEYGNPDMRQNYKKACEYLANNKLLLRRPHENRKGVYYYLDYEQFLHHLKISEDKINKNKDSILEFLKGEEVRKLTSYCTENSIITKGFYGFFIFFFVNAIDNYLIKKQYQLLKNAVTRYQIHIKSYREQIKHQIEKSSKSKNKKEIEILLKLLSEDPRFEI